VFGDVKLNPPVGANGGAGDPNWNIPVLVVPEFTAG